MKYYPVDADGRKEYEISKVVGTSSSPLPPIEQPVYQLKPKPTFHYGLQPECWPEPLTGGYAVFTPTDEIRFMYLTFIYAGLGLWAVRIVHAKGRALDKGEIPLLLDQIESLGPKISRKLFAAHIRNCLICGRLLTRADSRRAGIGPYCAANSPLLGGVV